MVLINDVKLRIDFGNRFETVGHLHHDNFLQNLWIFKLEKLLYTFIHQIIIVLLPYLAFGDDKTANELFKALNIVFFVIVSKIMEHLIVVISF